MYTVYYYLCAFVVWSAASLAAAIDVSSKLDFDTDGAPPPPSNASRLSSAVENVTGHDSSLSTGLVNAYINLQQNIQTTSTRNRSDTLAEELDVFGKVAVGGGGRENDAGPSKLIHSNICVNQKCVGGRTRDDDDKLLTDVHVTVLANVNGAQGGASTPTERPKDVPVFVGSTGGGNKFVPFNNGLGTNAQVPVFTSNGGHRATSGPDFTGRRRVYVPADQYVPRPRKTYVSDPYGLHFDRDVGFVPRHQSTTRYYIKPSVFTPSPGNQFSSSCVCPPTVDTQYTGSRLNPRWTPRVDRGSENLRVDDKVEQI